jgi:predicted trehalose synthase
MSAKPRRISMRRSAKSWRISAAHVREVLAHPGAHVRESLAHLGAQVARLGAQIGDAFPGLLGDVLQHGDAGGHIVRRVSHGVSIAAVPSAVVARLVTMRSALADRFPRQAED